MYVKGETRVIPGVGIAVVEDVLPSGSSIVRDCLGRSWLVSCPRARRSAVRGKARPLVLFRGGRSATQCEGNSMERTSAGKATQGRKSRRTKKQ